MDRLSAHVLDAGMAAAAEEAVFVATYQVESAAMAARGHQIASGAADAGSDGGRILRSVFMKPESEVAVPGLVRDIESLIASVGPGPAQG